MFKFNLMCAHEARRKALEAEYLEVFDNIMRNVKYRNFSHLVGHRLQPETVALLKAKGYTVEAITYNDLDVTLTKPIKVKGHKVTW